MKTDEFSFVNQQLAGMLQSGIPLESALRQLSATMRSGPLRDELQRLERDLARGTPLEEALAARKLPPLYKQMIQVGAAGNDLPGMLTLLADYYGRLHALSARLKGLAVYPAILLIVALMLSIGLALICTSLLGVLNLDIQERPAALQQSLIALWLAPALLAALTGSILAAVTLRPIRERLLCRLPGFKEARISQVASALALLLRNGGSLNQALAFLRELEAGSEAGRDIARWQSRLAEGHARVNEFAAEGKFFPPLFKWLVAGAGEDLAAGFDRAARLYYSRANYRVELMLYAFLPVSILTLGMLMLAQMAPVINVMHQIGGLMDMT
jgi:type II secretory pathway component PulF